MTAFRVACIASAHRGTGENAWYRTTGINKFFDDGTNFASGTSELGFRRASYEYFALWLRDVETDLPLMDAEELKSLLHALRKRMRTRNRQ